MLVFQAACSEDELLLSEGLTACSGLEEQSFMLHRNSSAAHDIKLVGVLHKESKE